MKRFESDLKKLLSTYDCELINYQYFKKIFGNIVLKIRCLEHDLNFVTDRGEISCNGVLLCTYEYIKKENKTTPQKLLEQIELKLVEIQKNNK